MYPLHGFIQFRPYDELIAAGYAQQAQPPLFLTQDTGQGLGCLFDFLFIPACVGRQFGNT